jgi:WD40 repeat protein/serine/threonine protein kinase
VIDTDDSPPEDLRTQETVALPAAKGQSSADGETFDKARTRPDAEGAEPADSAPLEAGTVVGHFRVIRMLGRGGMGSVYLARDLRLGRKVALKLVHDDLLASSEEILQQFLLEARMTAKFNHPNIVTIYAVGQFGHAPFVALEYLEGQNLRERMQEQRLSLAESLRICLSVAEGMQEAHKHGVLHRDLKPANVLIPSDGRVRVVDFGLAHELVDRRQSAEMLDSDDGQGESSGARGTPAYMSPEQWMNYELGPAVDVWALGLVLFELCAERLPYEERKMIRLFHAVTGDDAVPRLATMAEVPVAVDALVARCLEKKPERRPQASHVVDSLREILLDSRQHTSEEESPFRGLLAFAERHASLFYGRDAEVASVVERLRQEPVLAIVGPSGVGKSSFIQAGLVPRLREQGRWLVLRMRPGDKPLRRLATRLLAAHEGETGSRSVGGSGDAGPLHFGDSVDPSGEFDTSQRRTTRPTQILDLAERVATNPGQLALELHSIATTREGRVLLFIDQMEEVFTLCDNADAALAFVRAVCTAADDLSEPVRVVFSVRDDFLGRLAQVGPAVREVLRHVMVLHSPDKETLVEILTAPLKARGYSFDDDTLAVRMVESVDAKASLPLLQFAARRLWDQRDRVKRLLRDADYEKMGGVIGALIQHADSLLHGMSVGELRLARDVLLRMVTPEKTRRIVAKYALLDGLPAEAEAVLDRLTQSRLISVTKSGRHIDAEAQLELAHESLIHNWGLLSTWLDEGRDELVFLAEAGQAAELWDKRGRREEELWDELALRDAARRTQDSKTELPSLVQAFFLSGHRAHARRVWRKRGILGILLAGLTSASVVFAIQKRQADEQRDFASYQWKRAEKQRKVASRQRSEAVFESGRGAYDRGDVLEARAKLRLAVEGGVSSPSARRLWLELKQDPRRWSQVMAGTLYDVAISPDGSRLAVACQDGLAYLFDVQTKAMQVLRGGEGQVLAVGFSPDGKRLATAGTSAVVHLWDVQSGKEVQRLRRHESLVRRVRFDRSGKHVVSSSGDQTVVWAAKDGRVVRTLESPKSVRDLDISPDGRLLAVAGMGYRLYDLATGKLRREGRAERLIRSVRFSNSGKMLALGGHPVAASDSSAQAGPGLVVVDTATGEELTKFARGRKIHAARFSAADKQIFTTDEQAGVRVWGARDGRLEKVVGRGPLGQGADKKRCATWRCATALLGLALGPNGRWLATAGADHRVRVWDTARNKPKNIRKGSGAAVYAAAFHPTANIVASGSLDPTASVHLWSIDEARTLKVLPSRAAEALVFHPGGELVTGGVDGVLRIWNGSDGRPLRELAAHQAAVSDVAVGGRDKNLLASASLDGTVALWNYKTGQLRHRFDVSKPVQRIAFDGPGSALAASTHDGKLWLFDTIGLNIRWQEAVHDQVVYGLQFIDQGKQVVSGGSGGILKRIHVGSRIVETDPWRFGRINDIRLAPDQNTLLLASGDGAVRVRSLQKKARDRALYGHSGEVNKVAFSPDGKLAATGGDDQTLRLWDMKTFRPYWWASGLVGQPPTLWTQRGAVDLSHARGRMRQPVTEKGSWRFELLNLARLARSDAGNRILCSYSFEGLLKGWRLSDGQLLFKHPIQDIKDIHATEAGCFVLASEKALMVDLAGGVRSLPFAVGGRAEKVVSIGLSAKELLLVGGRELHRLSLAGNRVSRLPVGLGVTAVAAVGSGEKSTVFVGYRDGNVEIRSGGRGAAVAIQRRASGSVVSLLPVRADVLAVGYANGSVGLWNVKDGTRLRMGQLHGQARFLRFDNKIFYAGTDLASYLRWDLGHLFASDCELLNEIWKDVGVIWDEGVRRARPPTGHRCIQGLRPGK